MDIVYDEFLKELMASNIDFKSDTFKTMLIRPDYNPNKEDLFKNVSPYEFFSPNYIQGGTDVYFYLEDNFIKVDINKKASISWKNLTGEVRYIITYKIASNGEKVLIVCQDLGSTHNLDRDNLSIDWGETFLQIGQFIPKEPEKPDMEENLGILDTGVLGSMILGKDHLNESGSF